jgi:hypothetical protein
LRSVATPNIATTAPNATMVVSQTRNPILKAIFPPLGTMARLPRPATMLPPISQRCM